MLKKILNHPGNGVFYHTALLIARVGAGAAMMTHGYPKLLKLFGDEPITFADPIGLGETTSLVLTVLSEFFFSFLLVIGLWTRISLLPLFFTMLVAFAVVHSGDPFSDREASLSYMLLYILLFLTGPGKYSADRFLYPDRHN